MFGLSIFLPLFVSLDTKVFAVPFFFGLAAGIVVAVVVVVVGVVVAIAGNCVDDDGRGGVIEDAEPEAAVAGEPKASVG